MAPTPFRPAMHRQFAHSMKRTRVNLWEQDGKKVCGHCFLFLQFLAGFSMGWKSMLCNCFHFRITSFLGRRRVRQKWLGLSLERNTLPNAKLLSYGACMRRKWNKMRLLQTNSLLLPVIFSEKLENRLRWNKYRQLLCSNIIWTRITVNC